MVLCCRLVAFRLSFIISIGIGLLAGCGAPAATPTTELPQAVSSRPASVGNLRIDVPSYHASAAYEQALAALETPAATQAGIALDRDEAALSNWDVITSDDAEQIIRAPCLYLAAGSGGWDGLDPRGQRRSVRTTLQPYRYRNSLHIVGFSSLDGFRPFWHAR